MHIHTIHCTSCNLSITSRQPPASVPQVLPPPARCRFDRASPITTATHQFSEQTPWQRAQLQPWSSCKWPRTIGGPLGSWSASPTSSAGWSSSISTSSGSRRPSKPQRWPMFPSTWCCQTAQVGIRGVLLNAACRRARGCWPYQPMGEPPPPTSAPPQSRPVPCYLMRPPPPRSAPRRQGRHHAHGHRQRHLQGPSQEGGRGQGGHCHLGHAAPAGGRLRTAAALL